MIRALVFDFDGLILDTETPDYQSWNELYQEHGLTLSLESWALNVGSAHLFDPYAHFSNLLGRPVERDEIRPRLRARYRELLGTPTALPGVHDYLAQARELGLDLAIASSSPAHWVEGFLQQLHLRDYFSHVCTSDDVRQTKPEPDLYLKALERLDVAATQALALEDSPNGVRAAQAAGMRCVAVPNSVTRMMSLDHADLVIESLAAMPLPELLRRFA